MASQERSIIALILLVLTLPLVLAMVLKRSKQDIESMQAKSYANSVLRENKEVFDKLAEM